MLRSVVVGDISTMSSAVAAWRVNGQPIPYAPFRPGEILVDAGEVIAVPGVRGDVAVIPVERIVGPLLVVSAATTKLWRSVHCAVVALRRERGVPHTDSPA